LLRALIACGFASQHWTEIPTLAEHLFNKLAGVLPSYCLPETSAAHSRHFMPIGSLANGREQTTLVFDTWANLGDGEITIRWDCNLSDEETQQLQDLAASLGYLGRSESLVEAKLMRTGDIPASEFNAFPHQEGNHPRPQWEQVSLMAAIPPKEYAAWQREMTEKILQE